jgi:hypothetical protein
MTLAIQQAENSLKMARTELEEGRLAFAYQLLFGLGSKLSGAGFDNELLKQTAESFAEAKTRVQELEHELLQLEIASKHLGSPDGKADLGELEQSIFG